MVKLVVTLGITLVALLIGAAAVVGSRLLSAPPEQAAVGDRGGRTMVLARDDGSGPTQYRINTEPAPELPDRPSDASGIFAGRTDDAIVLGTGSINMDVEVTEGEEPQISMTSDGPEIEVVLTRDTLIYEDVTDMGAAMDRAEGGEVTVQQALRRVDSADGIGQNQEISVWGEKRGDRIIADVIVYRDAMSLR